MPMTNANIPLGQLDLNEKARAAVVRRFGVGTLTADNCAPGEEPFIGARAMDFEWNIAFPSEGVAGYYQAAGVREVARTLNLLADADLLIGLRQAPTVWSPEGSGQVRLSMRAMIAPGKYEAATELLSRSIEVSR